MARPQAGRPLSPTSPSKRQVAREIAAEEAQERKALFAPMRRFFNQHKAVLQPRFADYPRDSEALTRWPHYRALRKLYLAAQDGVSPSKQLAAMGDAMPKPGTARTAARGGNRSAPDCTKLDDPTPKREPEPGSELEPELEPERGPGPGPEPEPEPQRELEPEPEPVSAVEPQPELKPEPESESESEPDWEPEWEPGQLPRYRYSELESNRRKQTPGLQHQRGHQYVHQQHRAAEFQDFARQFAHEREQLAREQDHMVREQAERKMRAQAQHERELLARARRERILFAREQRERELRARELRERAVFASELRRQEMLVREEEECERLASERQQRERHAFEHHEREWLVHERQQREHKRMMQTREDEEHELYERMALDTGYVHQSGAEVIDPFLAHGHCERDAVLEHQALQLEAEAEQARLEALILAQRAASTRPALPARPRSRGARHVAQAQRRSPPNVATAGFACTQRAGSPSRSRQFVWPTGAHRAQLSPRQQPQPRSRGSPLWGAAHRVRRAAKQQLDAAKQQQHWDL